MSERRRVAPTGDYRSVSMLSGINNVGDEVHSPKGQADTHPYVRMKPKQNPALTQRGESLANQALRGVIGGVCA
jgi:hypothetical protein